MVEHGLRKGATFSSYADFKAALHVYKEEKNFVYKTGSGVLVEKFNSKLKAGDTPLDNKLKYKNKTIFCKHGGYKRKTESKGLRPNQK